MCFIDPLHKIRTNRVLEFSGKQFVAVHQYIVVIKIENSRATTISGTPIDKAQVVVDQPRF